jgi:hypothetical protein
VGSFLSMGRAARIVGAHGCGLWDGRRRSGQSGEGFRRQPGRDDGIRPSSALRRIIAPAPPSATTWDSNPATIVSPATAPNPPRVPSALRKATPPFSPSSEVSERDYFHAEARGSRRDFCKSPNPKALQFHPFNYSAGTSVFGFSANRDRPPRGSRHNGERRDSPPFHQ